MRRKERERDAAFAKQVLDTCVYATLSMVDEQGQPYCVPVNPARDGDALYIHAAMEGKKTDCLRAHARVCVAAVGRTRVPEGKFTMQYESAIAFGVAQEVTQEAEKVRALRLICEKFTPMDMDGFDAAVARSLARTAIWRIDIQSITGKSKPYEGWTVQTEEKK